MSTHQYFMFLMPVLAALSLAWFYLRRWHQLPASPGRCRALKPEFAIVLYLGSYVLQIIGVWIAVAAFGIDREIADPAEIPFDQIVQRQLGAYALALVVPVSFVFLIRRQHLRIDEKPMGIAPAVLVGVGAIVLTWPVCYVASTIMSELATLLEGTRPDAISHDTLEGMIQSEKGGWYFVNAGLVIIAVPILEEVVYRGLIQASLRRANLNGWFAIALTSVFFAMMHYQAVPWHGIPVLFVLSLAFGVAYDRTGRLTTPIIMHASFNLMNLVLAEYFVRPSG